MDFSFNGPKSFKIAIWIPIVLVLSLIIFFPCFGDISVFYSGGVRILEGGKIYVDWVDIKPPLIYYYFAAAIAVFGKGEYGIRIFDFFYQILTIYSLYFLVSKKIQQKSTAYFSCFIYALLYVTSNHSNTMQAETIAALPFIWSIYYFTKDNLKYKNILISGIFFGLASGLKYTLAFAFLGYLTDIFFAERNKEYRSSQKINFTLFYILSGIIGLAIASFPLLDYATRQGFIEMLGFLKLYSTYNLNINLILQQSIKTFGTIFGDNNSIPITFTAILGSLLVFKSNSISDFLKFLLFIALGLLISVEIEAKFFIYHYSRTLFIYSIFSGIGIQYLSQKLKLYKVNDLYNILILLIFSICTIFYSPIPRLINLVKLSTIKLKSQYEFDKNFKIKKVGDKLSFVLQAQNVANYINTHSKSTDTYCFMNSGSGSFIDKYISISDKNYIFAQSYFCNGVYKYSLYYNRYIYLLQHSNWVIISNNDTEVGFFQNSILSYEQFMNDSLSKSILYSKFQEVYHTENLYLYKRIK